MTETLLRYEFPSNEKLRTFLRLADLFKQLTWFAQQENANDHRAAIIKYFEIQEVTTRGDQKNDLLHELSRFRSCLEPLANNDNVDQESLKETLDKLQARRAELSCVGVRISHLSTQNEFLKTVGQRSGIPAGTVSLTSLFTTIGFIFRLKNGSIISMSGSSPCFPTAMPLI